jgi:6-pyruvoyl-tetrahydropterin synthase
MEPLKMKIKIDSIEFCAAQYLPKEFGKCFSLHGHNYQLRNIIVETDKIVDFKKIKEAIDLIDHCLLAPKKDEPFWKNIRLCANQYSTQYLIDQPVEFKIAYIPIEMIAVEFLGEEIRKELLKIDGIKDIHFELYETQNCGAQI